MKLTTNTDLSNFEAWSGAKDTRETILNHKKERNFEFLIDELYPDGLSDVQLNDILWFESDWIFEQLGIKDEKTNEEEE